MSQDLSRNIRVSSTTSWNLRSCQNNILDKVLEKRHSWFGCLKEKKYGWKDRLYWFMYWLSDLVIYLHTYWLISWINDMPTYCHKYWFMYWLSDWFTDSTFILQTYLHTLLIVWLADWLKYWFIFSRNNLITDWLTSHYWITCLLTDLLNSWCN